MDLRQKPYNSLKKDTFVSDSSFFHQNCGHNKDVYVFRVRMLQEQPICWFVAVAALGNIWGSKMESKMKILIWGRIKKNSFYTPPWLNCSKSAKEFEYVICFSEFWVLIVLFALWSIDVKMCWGIIAIIAILVQNVGSYFFSVFKRYLCSTICGLQWVIRARSSIAMSIFFRTLLKNL